MPTALGRRSGAVYGEKSPKTRLARIYCYGCKFDSLVSDVCVVHCIRGLPPVALSRGSNFGGEGFFFFIFFLFT